MNKQRLFITSCISLVTTSMVFAIRGDVEKAMGATFHLTHEQMGMIWNPAFWAFTVAIFISGALLDAVGMKILHALSSIGYLVGLTVVLFLAPHPNGPVDNIFTNTGTLLLYIGFFIMGLSQGLVEGVINPLIASIYNEDKTRKLNHLHAWWPGGLVIGGLLAAALGDMDWRIKLGLIYIPAVIYLIMALTMDYPKTERVVSNVSTGEMWREAFKPLFILLFLCMWMTAATELGPDQWFPSLMGSLVPAMKQPVLFLVYTAGLMFILRSTAGGLAHKLSPMGMLAGCSVLSTIGLYWLGSLQPGTATVFVAFAAATVFALGKTYYWPTMLGVTAEQFPRGGALLISIMGGTGMLSVAVALPIMGRYFDKLGAGPALQHVAFLPLILIFVFGALFLYFKSKGGYQAIRLTTDEATTFTTEEAVPAGEM